MNDKDLVEMLEDLKQQIVEVKSQLRHLEEKRDYLACLLERRENNLE